MHYGVIKAVIYDYRVKVSSTMSNLDGIERGYVELIRRSKTLSRIKPVTLYAQMLRVRRISCSVMVATPVSRSRC
jgi:hypothetical protein